MKAIDRTFAWLLVIANTMHCLGCLKAFLHTSPDLLLWTEATGIMGYLLPAVNLLRVNRPGDRGLAWVSAAGCVGWIVIAVWFGIGMGNILDPRPLIQSMLALALLGFSLRTALGRAGYSAMKSAGAPA